MSLLQRLTTMETSATSASPDRWMRYFDQHGALSESWLARAAEHWAFSERLRGNLVALARPRGRILEVGCGPGYSGILLSALGFSYTGIDNEPRLTELARSLAARLGYNATFEVGDARDLSAHHGKFDLAFSSGVLEHFERHETVDLLREQARCARVVVISIPTHWTRLTGEITDERIYSIGELRSIVRDAQLVPLRSFGYGDITATQGHLILYRILPRVLLRLAQDRGYAFAIAVAGKSLSFRELNEANASDQRP